MDPSASGREPSGSNTTADVALGTRFDDPLVEAVLHPSPSPRKRWLSCLLQSALFLLFVLAATIAPSLSCGGSKQPRIAVTRHSIAALDVAVRAYAIKAGALPNALDSLFLPNQPNPPFLPNRTGNDAWGTPVRYRITSPTSFEIRSAGPDKRMDTADDLVN